MLNSDNIGCRKNLTCRYLKSNGSPLLFTGSRPRQGSSNGEAEASVSQVQSLDLATISFLDPSILNHSQLDLPRREPPISEHILLLLGDTTAQHVTATKFFTFIHTWLPFISKPRFYARHLPLSSHSHASVSQTYLDTILLHLSVKLVTTLPPTNPRDPRTELYRAVKHFYLDVEQSGNCSIAVLQAGVLITLYELGQGIYPAAYLSIGACARYAHILGIGVFQHGGTQTRRVLTLVEMEERRRAWWAVVFLDRCVVFAFAMTVDSESGSIAMELCES